MAAAQAQDEYEEYDDDEEEEAGFKSEYSQYISGDDEQYLDDATTKSGGREPVKLTMDKLNLLQSQYFSKVKDQIGQTTVQSKIGETTAASISGIENVETETQTQMLRKSKMTQSRKSLKSIGVNDREKATKQVFNMNQEDIVQLPNKSFYNSDGSKIQILGTLY